MTRKPTRLITLRVLERVGFFSCACVIWRPVSCVERAAVDAVHAAPQPHDLVIQGDLMETAGTSMAERVARAAISFQLERTGHAPKAATVVLNGDTLVITLQEALSEAERTLARHPEGAARVREFHRELFSSSAEALRQEIQRITGVAVRESGAEVEIASGSVVHAFTSGTMVQVFQLVGTIPPAAWNAPETKDQAA